MKVVDSAAVDVDAELVKFVDAVDDAGAAETVAELVVAAHFSVVVVNLVVVVNFAFLYIL